MENSFSTERFGTDNLFGHIEALPQSIPFSSQGVGTSTPIKDLGVMEWCLGVSSPYRAHLSSLFR